MCKHVDVAHPSPCPWSSQAAQAHTVSTSGDDSVVPDSGATPALPTPQARSEGAVHRASRSGGARSAASKAEQAAAVAAAAASESAHGKAAAHFSHTQVTVVFLMLLASSFVTESIGIHAFFGAFLAGVIVPKEGPFVPMVGGCPPCFLGTTHGMQQPRSLARCWVCFNTPPNDLKLMWSIVAPCVIVCPSHTRLCCCCVCCCCMCCCCVVQLAERLEVVAGDFLLPLFFANAGLKLNINSLAAKDLGALVFVVSHPCPHSHPRHPARSV